VPGLDFVIVGTPRSGTTLVQRLAGELPGVRTPPETQLLSLFEHGTLQATFPLEGQQLRSILDTFGRVHHANGTEVDVSAIEQRLGGRAATLIDLFEAVVAAMTGPAAMTGEKTPEHLAWWRPLSVWRPGLKVIAVVRDPRAVVASNLAVPFGMRHAELIAERWARDQDDVRAAEAALGAERFLLVRYEDVVADEDAARRRLGAFLGRSTSATPPAAATGVPRAPTEYWKDRAAGPADATRADAWRSELAPEQIAVVTTLCRRHLESFGYDDDHQRARLSVAARIRRARYVAGRARRRARIERASVTTRRPGGRTSG
jgi:Sulfotransferase family